MRSVVEEEDAFVRSGRVRLLPSALCLSVFSVSTLHNGSSVLLCEWEGWRDEGQ